MKLNYSKRLAYCPAYTAIMIAYVDLLVNQQTHPKLEFGNNCQVYYITDDDHTIVIGATLFQIIDGEGHILFSFVKEEYRNKGVYKELYTAVENTMINNDVTMISSGTWNNNERMRHIYSSTDRDATSIRVVKTISKQIL